MRFKVISTEKHTGTDRTFVVECSSADEACAIASAEGFDVRYIEATQEQAEPANSPEVSPRPLDYQPSQPRQNRKKLLVRLILNPAILTITSILSGFLLIYLSSTIYPRYYDTSRVLNIIGIVLVSVGLLTALVAFPSHQSTSAPDAKLNPVMICPHCQSKGAVSTRAIEVKRGVSGTKAAAAILTGGVSVLVTGLSQKEPLTEARCSNCGNIWRF